MTKAKPSSPPPRFEDAVSELEAIVTRMESGQLPLEESLAAYRRGAELLRLCQGQLTDAEAQLRVLDGETLSPLSLAPESSA